MSDTFLKMQLSRAYKYAAEKSDDPSSQNGAVIVAGTWTFKGANVFYNGVPPEVEDRTVKLQRIEHAERAVIYAAARKSHLEDADMFCPWAACYDCARAIIGTGLRRLVVHKERQDLTDPRWKDQVEEALEWIKHSVPVIEVEGPIDAPPILVSGKLWSPRDLEYV